jgi:hypothetical protein
MAREEKGRPAGGDPIPNVVPQDIFEISITAGQLQSRRISGLYAVSAGCP